MSKNVAEEQKPFEIRNAALKDACCNYGYELLTGPNKGDIIPNRKGAHFIHEDLKNAFEELEVFIAHMDGVFNSWANNQTALSELEEKEALGSYSLHSFKIVGVEENKGVILYGEKYTANGRMPVETPKIKLEGTYLYIEELNQRLDVAIYEVELYMDGKKAPELEQTTLEFEPEHEEEQDDEFANAKVG
ncbi:hypothetical protein OX284_016970 [Flavobacterium sp. SUN046]|uniref:hypothetical protein n=1 Tax=Flavobacterium sp. SUN046 TaxID=3002440 RepID=UPI002DBC441E|nr:hypothetical protein [Flavobacterium sp. SUN046]MEC4051130.1 hypothetical protein [Flavobacterium sp. SUN046]